MKQATLWVFEGRSGMSMTEGGYTFVWKSGSGALDRNKSEPGGRQVRRSEGVQDVETEKSCNLAFAVETRPGGQDGQAKGRSGAVANGECLSCCEIQRADVGYCASAPTHYIAPCSLAVKCSP